MKLGQQSHSSIESAIREVLDKYSRGKEHSVITDIHLQPSQLTGELTIFDDDDTKLASATVEEWLNYDDLSFYKDAERYLRSIISKLKNEGRLDRLSIVQPYSFVLVDEDRETLSELLLVDSDVLLVNEELLKGLDKELDDFLKGLFE